MKSELLSIIKKFNLIDYTFELFEKNFHDYSIEDKEEFEIYFPNYNIKKRKVELYVIRYNIFDLEGADECISIELDILYESEKIGRYICLFFLHGTYYNDYFIID